MAENRPPYANIGEDPILAKQADAFEMVAAINVVGRELRDQEAANDAEKAYMDALESASAANESLVLNKSDKTV